MKKIIIVLLVAISLVACSDVAEAKLSDGSEVIWECGNQKYTKNDLYNTMRLNDYNATILNGIIQKIGVLDNLDLEKFKSDAEDEYNTYIEAGLESYITYYYLNKDNFINSYITNEIVVKEKEIEVTNNFDLYVQQNLPFKAEIVSFDTIEAAQNVIKAVTEDKQTFEFACSENGYTGTVYPVVYLDNDSTIPIEVKEELSKMTFPEISDVINVSDTYYLVNLISKDANEFKDELVTLLASNVVESEVIINNLLVKYDLCCHDQRTYEILHAIYGDVK